MTDSADSQSWADLFGDAAKCAARGCGYPASHGAHCADHATADEPCSCPTWARAEPRDGRAPWCRLCGSRPNRIYLSNSGHTGCDLPTHAPFRGSDSWVWDGWAEITDEERAELKSFLGDRPLCETCRAIAEKHGQED